MALHSVLNDLTVQIRNGQTKRKLEINVNNTTSSINILKVLKKEGFIRDYIIENNKINILLKYIADKPSISMIEPILINNRNNIVSVKKLVEKRNLLQMNNQGLGIFILTTSKGILSDIESIERNIGGQIILKVL